MTTPNDVADIVTGMCDGLFAVVGSIRELVEGQLDRPVVHRAELAIEEHCHAVLLDRTHKVAGAGLVIAPGLLEDTPYWLEWWTSDPDAATITPKRLATETDPRAIGFRDYTRLPWYAQPLQTGRPHITGPYVDYLCTDQQSLTFTEPVWRGGAFAGVAGVDLLVRTVEERVFEAMASVPGECAVINEVGRVVTASDPALVTGDLVRGLPLQQWWAGEPATHERWACVPCPGLPLGVIHTRG